MVKLACRRCRCIAIVTLSAWLILPIPLEAQPPRDAGSQAENVQAEKSLAENQLFDRLLQEGIRLDGDARVKLPAPSLSDGLDGDGQMAVLRQVAGTGRYETFVRPSAVAPFTLRQAYLKDTQGNRVGHAVDLWFLAYARLADLTDPRLADDFFGPEPSSENSEQNGEVRELTDIELSHIGLSEINRNQQRFVLAEFPLMNRIQVRGVGHAQQSRSDQSLLIAWELDERFRDHPELGGQWRPWETDNLGQRSLGAASPYQGYAGYVKITQLQQPDGALLFEAHVVFHEPQAWFRGSNFLRSKTPLLVKENVDKLRRKLVRMANADN